MESNAPSSSALVSTTTPRFSSGTSITRETKPAVPAVIVEQAPAQSVVREIWLQSRQGRRRVCNRQNRLWRPHFLGLPLAEQSAIAVGELSTVELQLHPFRHIGRA